LWPRLPWWPAAAAAAAPRTGTSAPEPEPELLLLPELTPLPSMPWPCPPPMPRRDSLPPPPPPAAAEKALRQVSKSDGKVADSSAGKRDSSPTKKSVKIDSLFSQPSRSRHISNRNYTLWVGGLDLDKHWEGPGDSISSSAYLPVLHFGFSNLV
ncbi:hypothetical protein BHE74_00052786, partial [Ensete ventricosum]